MFLSKLYTISSEPSRLLIPEPILLKEEINNLEKIFKILQSPMKTIPFLLSVYYKSIWLDRENNIQYWNEITAEFIKQKHNSNTSHWRFLIKMYSEGLLHEPFFIILNLQETIVIGLTKKLVTLYMVRNLAFLD